MNKSKYILNHDIEKQISLFDVSNKPVETININELEKVYQFNLISENINIEDKINESQKILKYVIK